MIDLVSCYGQCKAKSSWELLATSNQRQFPFRGANIMCGTKGFSPSCSPDPSRIYQPVCGTANAPAIPLIEV